MDTLGNTKDMIAADVLGPILKGDSSWGWQTDQRWKNDEQQATGIVMCETFKADRNQAVYKERDVHALQLAKDNLPEYFTDVEALLLDVTLPPATMECILSTQMQKNDQCKEIMKKSITTM